MPSQRHFLGWDSPVLPAASAWLWQRFGADMSGVILAVPAARAGRRLLELLADSAAQNNSDAGGVAGVLIPPTIETVGALPEWLYEHDGEVADELAAALGRAAALRSADRATLERVVPHPPSDDDAVGWFRLADQLGAISSELAAARLTPGHVVEMAGRLQIDLGLSSERWDALEVLEQHTCATLGRPDRQAARLAAIRDGRCGCDRAVVLVGLVDVSAMLRGMLDQLDDVTALVPAPSSHAEGFDALGVMVTEYWGKQSVEVGDLRFVDQPRDQAVEVVRVLGELPTGTAADEVSVGLGDEDAAGSLERAIVLAGTPARAAMGRSLRTSSPVVLLDLLGRYAGRRRFSELASLVRHPALAGVVGDDQPWLTRLDKYVSTYLQADTRLGWRGSEDDRAGFDAMQQRLDGLLPEGADRRQSLPGWSEAIAGVLRRGYGTRTLDRRRDHTLVEALRLIRVALQQQAALDAAHPTTPSVSFAEAAALTVSRLASGRIPEPGGGPAVELLGFLELAWDDAPFAVLTDVSEGMLPDSRSADAFLPNTLRSGLGLPDNEQRYARDVLLMNIVMRSKQRVTVLACRRSPEGDPRVPSRLLLACEEDLRIARVRSFYDESAAPRQTPLLLTPGKVSRFLIPRPLLDEPPLEKLSVTAFRDYLACPYRFYLKHVARLGSLDDRALEMDALAFGSLAHAVLEDFGKSELFDATDGSVIADMLSERLDARAGARFGRQPRPAVRVQVEQLRQRLTQFAEVQAAEARDGWRIRTDLIEKKRQATVELDGQPFTITGTIDRIDQHPELGFRVLDYKTSDAAQPPEKTHQKQGQWVDLQLPLYRVLVEPLGISTPTLGYINLSKSAAGKGATGVVLAKWSEDELAEAMAQRDVVIRGVRERRFWPPSQEPPKYGDAFTRLAADKALDRSDLIGGKA